VSTGGGAEAPASSGVGASSSGGAANLTGGGSGGIAPTGDTGGSGASSASGGTSGSSGASGTGATGGSGADPNFHIFLLFGQSNMEGIPSPEAADRVEDARVQVLAYANCPSLGRTYNEWYTASPPLHRCWAGVGPGDYFGKGMIEAYPDSRIGLVPHGISGADIDMFRKDVVSSRRGEFTIPPDDHWSGAYEWMIERAQLAQESGVIRGILFHQGESDNTDPAWPGKVAGIVSDLRQDLGLADSVPFIAGEMLYTGLCSAHNALVAELPGLIPTSAVVSAEGLGGMDRYHFDLAGQREFGDRCATAMLSLLVLT